jgi:hypothetical protein
MEYKDKILKAISLTDTLENLEFIDEKIRTTSQINRKTKQGRELTQELLTLTNRKAQELINSGAEPF